MTSYMIKDVNDQYWKAMLDGNSEWGWGDMVDDIRDGTIFDGRDLLLAFHISARNAREYYIVTVETTLQEL